MTRDVREWACDECCEVFRAPHRPRPACPGCGPGTKVVKVEGPDDEPSTDWHGYTEREWRRMQ